MKWLEDFLYAESTRQVLQGSSKSYHVGVLDVQ